MSELYDQATIVTNEPVELKDVSYHFNTKRNDSNVYFKGVSIYILVKHNSIKDLYLDRLERDVQIRLCLMKLGFDEYLRTLIMLYLKRFEYSQEYYRIPKCRIYYNHSDRKIRISRSIDIARSFIVPDEYYKLRNIRMVFNHYTSFPFVYNNIEKIWVLNYFNSPYDPFRMLTMSFSETFITMDINIHEKSDIFVECDILNIKHKQKMMVGYNTNPKYQVSKDTYVSYIMGGMCVIKDDKISSDSNIF
jgi:hypothetical protein